MSVVTSVTFPVVIAQRRHQNGRLSAGKCRRWRQPMNSDVSIPEILLLAFLWADVNRLMSKI